MAYNLSINQKEANTLLELLQLQKALTIDQKEIAEKLLRYLGRKPLPKAQNAKVAHYRNFRSRGERKGETWVKEHHAVGLSKPGASKGGNMRCPMILLAGWFLMVPPRFGSTTTLADPDKPLSKWKLERSFDTAKECEDYRDQMFDFYDLKQKQDTKQYQYFVDAYANARCIPSDQYSI